MIQNIILLGIIFFLLHLANVTEALSFITRPMVVMVADALGIPAVDRGNDILLGQVVLPWNQDCSGINGLILLLGITLWVNRHQRFGIPFLLRLGLCIPAAVISNVFRRGRSTCFPKWHLLGAQIVAGKSSDCGTPESHRNHTRIIDGRAKTMVKILAGGCGYISRVTRITRGFCVFAVAKAQSLSFAIE